MKIGVIGGSGLYQIDGLTDEKWVKVSTPFGDPSDELLVGRVGGNELIFLPRHGRGHRIAPHEINFRANIWALKHLGATRVVSVSAVGSMKESIVPGHLVVPDQFFDRTQGRVGTFFGEGVVAHVSLAQPVCSHLADTLASTARDLKIPVHSGGTYVCINGPQFSTKAESLVFRSWGVSVIGMTNVPEARLAREAELCYATLALATDYDCWHESEEAVSVESVMAVMRGNVANARRVISSVVASANQAPPCSCQSALAGAIMTDPKVIPAKTRERLALLIGKYI